ncbi:MAG: DUF116 domain-containing protein [Ignavibacteriales bacterium]
MSENKTFIKASSMLAVCLLIISGGFIGAYFYLDANLINMLLLVIAGILVLLTILIVIGIFFVINGESTRKNTKEYWLLYYFTKNIIIPLIKPFSKMFGIDSESMQRFFININNKVVQSRDNNYKNTEIVLLLPHCLQNSACSVNITHDINNCKRCGKCDINTMIEISERYGIKLLVVTGGTSARAELSKLSPGAVVAVACERDLSSGINDVDNVPVYGVLNMRPNGPCNNTRVDAVKIEEAIKKLIDKNNLSAGE